MSEQELLSYFPYPTFRKHQEWAIESIAKAFTEGKKFVILEAPTGSGKSPIAMTLAGYYDNAYIMTPQKILQKQYMTDFEDELVELKGRGNYMCPATDGENNCDSGLCKQSGRHSFEHCKAINLNEDNETFNAATLDRLKLKYINTITCPFYRQIALTQAAKTTLFNFKSFLYQTFKADNFDSRKLMVIDEAHNIEAELVDIFSVKFSVPVLKDISITIPNTNSITATLAKFEQQLLHKRLKDKIVDCRARKEFLDASKWENMLKDYEYLTQNARDDNYVIIHGADKYKKAGRDIESRYIIFKPLHINDQAQKMFAYGDKVLLMSATILSPKILMENLGIEKTDAEFIRLPNTFPVENRKITFVPTGFMTYKYIDKTMPKLVKNIEKVLKHHEHDKGIIHTHSYKILNAIKDNIDYNFKWRLLFQPDFKSREEMIRVHTDRIKSVIVAPALHEGLDLKNKLSRFQILCKVPYPNAKADAWMERRVKESWHYYQWLTALKLVQSYGRSVRSETDYAQTYIFDSQFEKFMNQCKGMLPSWFTEAVVRGKI